VCDIGNNDVTIAEDAIYTEIPFNITPNGLAGVWNKKDGWHTTLIPAAGTAKLLVGGAGLRVWLEMFTNNSPAAYGSGYLDKLGNLRTTPIGAFSATTGMATIPTGTNGTGNTLNVHYDGQYLYFGNQRAAAMDIFVKAIGE
jgi:hypothetical protein